MSWRNISEMTEKKKSKERKRLNNLNLQDLLLEVHLDVNANKEIVELVKKSKHYTVKTIITRVINILLNNQWTQNDKWKQVMGIYEEVRAKECETTECDDDEDDEEPYLFKPKCTDLRF